MDASTHRPRVGFVLERSLGHVTHADNLARILPAEGAIDAELLPIDFAVEGWPARVPVYRSNWTVRSGWRARRRIRQAHGTAPLDALLIHTQVPAVMSHRWMKRIPTVVSLDATPMQYDELGSHYDHGRSHAAVESLKHGANRRSFELAAHVVTWSEWAKQGVVDGYGTDPDRITVIPPGVTPSLWARSGPRSPSGDVVRVLFVGGDLVRKGGDVLLRAFSALREGLGERRVELHLVTRTAVAPRPDVHLHSDLTPNSPELISLYHQSDIFCLPTRGDCLPMVLSEAGAAGLAAVATAVAGIPEIVLDGETGLIVPPDDAAALTRALRRLVDDAALRRRLGTAAQELVASRFDAEKNARRLVELLVREVDPALSRAA
jgi:glycosyltransferase involved in cell wall biosynthesis